MASSGSKRQNAHLDKSYKRAVGIADERREAFINPTRIIEAAFLLIALVALDTHSQSTHGVSPLREVKTRVVGAWRGARRWLSRTISPGSAGRASGGGGGRGAKSNSSTGKKQFKGKGRKLGKK